MPNEQEIPDVVYHYTSMRALLAIVKSRSIWATNIRYLNDVLERQHCLSAVKKHVESVVPRTPLYEELLERIKSDEDEHKRFYELPCVASFSREKDSLTQWRSYCPQGNGVCIGFRTESLLGASATPQDDTLDPPDDPLEQPINLGPYVTFGPVRYLDETKAQEVQELFERVLKEADTMEAENEDAEESMHYPSMTTIDFLWYAIDRHASLTKHHSFESEGEYRLIATNPNYIEDVFCFRPSRSTLIPYIPLFLNNPKRPLERKIGAGHVIPFERRITTRKLIPSFIDSIIVGPTPHPDLSVDAIREMFWQRGVDVFVDESDVPFRDW